MTGRVLATIPAAGGGADSGLAWAEGSLLESDGGDQFFAGGGNSGKVRAIRRPR
jgi:hypothetical protein